MKLKGVNPLEQHVEKIVLAGVSVVFLGVLAMQFLFEPNKVKVVGTSEALRPGQAFLPVETKARALQGIMTQQDLTSRLPPAPKYDLVNQLRNVREAPLVPPRSYAFGPKSAVEGTNATVGDHGADRIAPLTVQAPAHVVAAAFRGTLDPTEPENIPGLKPFVPAEQPLDTKAVSVACVFDGAALKSALAAAPEASGVKAIPTTWWRDSMEIMSVRLERQEQKPDGDWSEPAEVAAPPGRFTMVDRLRGVHGAQDLTDAVVEARSAADDIQRPTFYRMIAGQPWAPPIEGAGPAEAAGAKSPEVDHLVEQNKTKQKSIDSLKKQLEDTEKMPVRAAPPRDIGGGGGGGGGGGKGAGGGGQAPPSGQQGPSITQQEKDSRIKRLNGLIKDAESQMAKNNDALSALGRDPMGKPLGNTPATGADPSKAPAAKPLLENPEIKLWSHDLTIQPGKTYRYRVMVGLNNPAFARTSALVADQQDLAASALVFSQPSEWSEPVQVLPDQFYFLTSATEADALGPPRATAEVFRFFYGYYRKASLSLEPGDVIATNIKLPDPNKLPIYDLKALAGAPGQPPTPGAPPTPPSAPSPGGKGGARFQGDGRGQPGPANPGQPETPKITLPANAKPYPKQTIPAAIEAMLLDVAKTVAGEGPARSQAFLRAADGLVIVAVPEEQRRSPVYQMAAASAKEGENQGQPIAPAADPNKDPNKPPAPPKGPNIRPPPPGGGGGGAGGG